MIKPENIYEATQDAFDKGEFYELLTGCNGYDVPILDVSVNIPTDWSVVVPDGIFCLYSHNPNDAPKIKQDFEKALEQMINGNAVEIWEDAYVIFFVLKHYRNGRAPFTLPENIIASFNKQVQAHREELAVCKKYDGDLFSNGLLGDIERLRQKYAAYLSSRHELRN